jgi:excisionase family DNA binding protein
MGSVSTTTHHLFLSVTEAAGRIGVSRRTAYTLARRRELPTVRLGGCMKVPIAALEQWVRDREAEALEGIRRKGAP